MEFYSFPTLKENMLKHYFMDVNGPEKHTGADGFVLFCLQIELWAFFTQIWTF